jgi:type III secretion system YscI/HrpB-like protein
VAIQFSTTVLAQAVQAASPVAPAAAAPAAADAAQVAQFRASLDSVSPTSGVDLSSASPMPEASAASSATAGSSSTSAPTGPVSLGDTILKGLDHLRDRMKDGWSSAVAPLDAANGPISAAGLLQVQSGVLQVGFETQLIGTIAGKTSQSIDQLVKMQ